MSRGRASAVPYDIRRRCLIAGLVQMVGFRMFAIHHGQRLGLRGWVRNLSTGEVEVLVEGPPLAVAEFLTLLKRGPAPAQVSSFVVSEEKFGPLLTQFGEALS
ncbi:MAG TPA: acylphosphatase [Candidatus Dormibacteraeota bacterium]|nr:acylphosphatase [Candidatus Dormibacteraeota bacterium]